MQQGATESQRFQIQARLDARLTIRTLCVGALFFYRKLIETLPGSGRMWTSRSSAMTIGRKSLRRRVLKGAVAAFNARHSTIPCTVRDLSDDGCRIATPSWQSVPDTFELIVELDGLSVPCEVAWRRNGHLGVRFTDKPRIQEPRRQQVVDAIVPPKRPSLRRR
jgi:hypothetical protein